LVEYWTIVSGEWPLIEHKHGATRLGFAVLFKFFQYAGYFPRGSCWIPGSYTPCTGLKHLI